ncbi:NrfD/PsrC family molybdoenzyme membrane anchor subunit [Mesobacillus selenatarsenatis]|uniref:MolyBDOPTERIN oxidOREDUCTASE, membranE subuNIT n=1 Tax=Mesobacillus selenatarsenatis (strain DSM 18680 / JCM 14380 / FERM P-15431 / SF-1) TaxID=1321606 RepID=A0A0A8XEH6_MESS1|nr:NrfD/PsrC family molybdoenzyme membrane anchor subunit [Mesobacillus selenatarsenatis]GAM16541.1 molyBDOPTERIN oxidOREDUCTASE, membranE subuNIT [Mesobacillus selenatarsenatis SF-1]
MKINKWTILSAAFILFGLAGAANIFIHGEHAMGTTNKIPWGILIAGYEYFVGISTGLLLVAALGYVFHVKAIIPIGKSLLMFAIFSLISGFAILLVELGNPLNFIHYFLTPNFTSPIWWMAPLYGIYLMLLVTLTVFVVRENESLIRPLAIMTAISALVALICIGFLFGFIIARPYWNGPISPLYFILTSVFSGIAMASVIAYLHGRKKTRKNLETVKFLRTLSLSMMGVMVVIYIGKTFVGLYGQVPGKYESLLALLTGPLSFNYWVLEISLAIVIPFVLIVSAHKLSAIKLGLAGLLSLTGIFFMRFNMVIAGQITPLKVVKNPAEETVFNLFSVTWSEWALIMGGIGIMAMLYLQRELLERIIKHKPATELKRHGDVTL